MKNRAPGWSTLRRKGLPKHKRTASAVSSETIAFGVRVLPQPISVVDITVATTHALSTPAALRKGNHARAVLVGAGQEEQKIANSRDAEPLQARCEARPHAPQRGDVLGQFAKEHAGAPCGFRPSLRWESSEKREL